MKYVAIDKEYEIATKNHGTQKTAENFLEVPECETLEEAVKFCGGSEASVVDVVNDAIRSGAKNGALAVIRNAAEGVSLSEVFEKAKNYARTFTFSLDRGPSKKKTLEAVDQLRELRTTGALDEMSKEDLLALLSQSLLK
jgi:hypothetical protein